MKKLAVVLGVAAVATFTGCKDPDYVGSRGKTVQDEPKSIATEPEKPVETPAVKTAEIQVEDVKCTCPSGTKHTSPCKCGASDCKCVVEKPVVAPVPVPAPEYTTYIVQNGDYLAKISKKYNVTINSIKRINNLKTDSIRVGQKLKLPGKIDVGVQDAPVVASVKTVKSGKKGYVPYTGATKEYVVKNGDTLGSVAYGNGINIRQLKELNKLSGDSLKIGQKLKIPAEKVVAEKKPVAAKEVKAASVKADSAKAAPVKVETPAAPVTQPVEEKTPAAPVAEEASAPAPTPEPAATPAEPQAEAVSAPAPAPATTTYVVQEGEDLTRLAVDFGVTPTVIRELNNLGENDTIKPGQVLKLPAEAQQ